MNKLLTIAAIATLTQACNIVSTRPRNPILDSKAPTPVCVLVPLELKEDAKRGIEWWGEPVVYTCDEDDGPLLVHLGDAAPTNPGACAYYDSYTAEITIVCDDAVSKWAKHEFGHVLGYGDDPSCQGVMGSGYFYADGCTPIARGSW